MKYPCNIAFKLKLTVASARVAMSGFLGIALVIGALFQAEISSAQNLATNAGFENGNTTGWFAFGSPVISAQTSQVHSGSYAALVTNRTAGYMGIAQSFKDVFQAGQTYNISAWLRLASGTSQTMQLTMQKVDGSGTAYSAVASGSVTASGWTQLSGQFTFNYSGTLTSLVLYAEVPTSTNAAYFWTTYWSNHRTSVLQPDSAP